jgi:hypothetical protein
MYEAIAAMRGQQEGNVRRGSDAPAPPGSPLDSLCSSSQTTGHFRLLVDMVSGQFVTLKANMSTGASSWLPKIVSTLELLKNVVALAPLGEHVGAGIELAISICEMARVRDKSLFL